MKTICKNGLVIDCGNFKAIDGGVVLTEDAKRKRPMGFVPTGELRYVLPDEVAATDDAKEASDADGASHEGRERPRSTETDVPSPAQRRTVARLRDRLDRIEAAVELSHADDAGQSPRPADEQASDTRATTDADAESDVLRVTGGDGSNGDPENVDSTAEDAERASGLDTGREDTASEDEEDAYPELQQVDGLGPTYAGRLHDDGIETLADLEAANADEVATIADVGTTRAEDWITQAGELT